MRKNKLKHDYSLAAYLLNPHPKVMAEAGSAKSLDHDEAVERLIAKLILPRNLVGDDKKIKLARLIDLFWSEYANFTNRLGKFNSDGMWIIAKMDTNLAHEWHKKYSVTRTQVLGRVSCLVLSKILGTGTAERHWKLVKEAKKGQRNNIKTEKLDKQVHIYGVHGQARAKIRALVCTQTCSPMSTF